MESQTCSTLIPRTTFEGLLIDILRDLYDAENQMVGTLPEMENDVESAELATVFRENLSQAGVHVQQLRKIFAALTIQLHPLDKKSRNMEDLVMSAHEILENNLESHLKDVALITCAQKMTHYKISGYSIASTFSKLLNQQEISKQLHRMMIEEVDTDEQLSELARQFNRTLAEVLS
jgi:ferritin-like metal-binding protein YciE